LATLPDSWQLDVSAVEEPMVLFRFPAPLDNYTGVVGRVSGKIQLPEDRRLEGTRGFVTVDPVSITMGVADLDEVLQGSMFLYTRKHPTAGFTVDTVTADGRPLAYGRMTTAGVSGTFALKGKKMPLSLPMELEPVVDRDGSPMLLARGRFRIDLRNYDIEGAEGPAPARFTVQIDLNLRFTPAAQP
jgi:polyisoprenoid-binding protein YceI